MKLQSMIKTLIGFILTALTVCVVPPAVAENMEHEAVEYPYHQLQREFEKFVAAGTVSSHKTGLKSEIKMCEKGDSNWCYWAGKSAETDVISKGESYQLSRDYIKARSFYTKACELEEADACFDLGKMLQSGIGGEKDQALATALFTKACKLEKKEACTPPQPSEVNPKKGEAVYESMMARCRITAGGCYNTRPRAIAISCTYGNPDRCFEHASMLAFDRNGKGLIPSGQHYDDHLIEPLKHFYLACEAKIAEACTNLGYMLHQDLSIVPSAIDEYDAMFFSVMACRQGEPTGCHNVAWLLEKLHYEKGPRSTKLTASYYAKACDGKVAQACRNLLKIISDNSFHLDKSKTIERAISEKSCELEDPIGCTNLGSMLAMGKGGNIDLEKAKSLFLNACHKNKLPTACFNLGVINYAIRDDKLKNGKTCKDIQNFYGEAITCDASYSSSYDCNEELDKNCNALLFLSSRTPIKKRSE